MNGHFMNRTSLSILVAFGFHATSPLWAGPAPAAGTVFGVVPLPNRAAVRIPVEKYAGSISGKVGTSPPQIAGVWLERSGLAAPTNPPTVNLSQKNYQFNRSLLVIPKGSTVEFPNEDPDFHNIFSTSKTKRFDVGRYKKQKAPVPSEQFAEAGFVRLQCEIHDHMNAVILVVDSPYFSTTDTSGKFTLSGVPAGTYTLRAQLDEKNQWSSIVQVQAGQSTGANFTQTTFASVKAP
jgi:plastocyanin